LALYLAQLVTQVVQPSLVKPVIEMPKKSMMIIMGNLRLTQYSLGEVKMLVGALSTRGNVAQKVGHGGQ